MPTYNIIMLLLHSNLTQKLALLAGLIRFIDIIQQGRTFWAILYIRERVALFLSSRATSGAGASRSLCERTSRL